MHIYQEGALQLRQDLPLVDDRLDTALSDNTGFAHLFKGKHLVGLAALHFPHLAEAALPNAVVVHEVGLAHRCKLC